MNNSKIYVVFERLDNHFIQTQTIVCSYQSLDLAKKKVEELTTNKQNLLEIRECFDEELEEWECVNESPFFYGKVEDTKYQEWEVRYGEFFEKRLTYYLAKYNLDRDVFLNAGNYDISYTLEETELL